MTFWRPAHEWRGTRGYWFDSPSFMRTEMSKLAAKLIYQRFNLIPPLLSADNDTDDLRW
jgi:hypothetical protein